MSTNQDRSSPQLFGLILAAIPADYPRQVAGILEIDASDLDHLVMLGSQLVTDLPVPQLGLQHPVAMTATGPLELS